jgi:PAS domain S-box-containing protein
MLVSSAAMLLIGGTFIAYQWFTERQRMVVNMSAQAEIYAGNCKAALSFGDQEDAAETLSSLHYTKSIVFACIYRPDGSLFAKYQRGDFAGGSPSAGTREEGYRFVNGWLVMRKKIALGSDLIGSIYLQSNLSELYALIKQSAVPLSILILMALVAAYLLSSKLQEVISAPLFHLAKIARTVSKNEDYSVRAVKQSEDEIGQLTDAFNRMLSQVEKRDIALRESEEKYRSLYNTSRDAIMISTPDGKIVSANPATIKLFGCQNEVELISKSTEAFSPKNQPDGASSNEKFTKMLNIALNKGSHFFEWKQKKINGEEFYAEVMLNSMNLQDESIVHASIRNITDRKNNEEELRRLRNLLSNIINSMPSVLVGVDMEGRVTHWNREAEKITGVNADDARGCTLADVFPQLSGEMEKVVEAIRERVPLKDEKIPSEVNGEVRYSDITVYPLTSNGVEGAVIRVDDITERVRIEEMMIQSEKMLSVGGLAAGMAHEINNPLAGILQNVQVIRNRIKMGLPKNNEIARLCGTSIDVVENYVKERGIFPMIDSVMESGRRASKIVDNMLSFSRKSDSNFSPHNLAALLDKTVELASNDYDLKKKYDFRQIEIVREYKENVHEILCEASKLQQVFLNILKNGAQAMSEKKYATAKPLFILRILREDTSVRIDIEDNGPGMDEMTRKRIFEPFFTTKGVGLGTGLGLSVSYFIITENHNGRMAVESVAGKGTNFIIHLPLERSIP